MKKHIHTAALMHMHARPTPVRLGLRAKGLTLVELLTVLAIMAVLLTMAAPSLVHYQRNSQLSGATSELVHALHLARNEALRTGYNTLVQPTSGNDWQGGWHSYIDFDRNNAYTAGTDQLLYTAAAAPEYLHISGQRTAQAGAYISFSGNGFARAITQQGPPNMTVTLERSDSQAAEQPHTTRQVIVSRSGRVRSCNPTLESTCTAAANY